MTEQQAEAKPLREWTDEELDAERVRLEATYIDEANRLWEKLVPKQGRAFTLHGELLRCVARISRDLSVNGWCNVSCDHFADYYNLVRSYDREIRNKLADFRDLKLLWGAYDQFLTEMKEDEDEECRYCSPSSSAIHVDKHYRLVLLLMERVQEAAVRVVAEVDEKFEAARREGGLD